MSLHLKIEERTGPDFGVREYRIVGTENGRVTYGPWHYRKADAQRDAGFLAQSFYDRSAEGRKGHATKL